MTKGNGESGDENEQNKQSLGMFSSTALANSVCCFQDLMQSHRIISHLLLQQRIEEPSKVLKQLKLARRPRNKTLVLIGHFKSTT